MVNGTEYEITSGKTKVNGTNYSIKGGKTKVDGTVYDVSFLTLMTIYVRRPELNGAYRAIQVPKGMTISEFINSEYNTICTDWYVSNSNYVCCKDSDNVTVWVYRGSSTDSMPYNCVGTYKFGSDGFIYFGYKD